MQNLSTLGQGEKETYTLTFIDSNGSPVVITNWTIWMTFKSDINLTDANADVQKKNLPGEHYPCTDHNKTQFTLTSDDTTNLQGQYHYSIRAKKSDGTPKDVEHGFIIIEVRATRSTS